MLTPEEKLIKVNAKMELTNFYIDPITKLKAIQKLNEIGLCAESRGTFSALLRALLSFFAECEDQELLSDIKDRTTTEYVITATKNKRSRL